MVGGVGGLLGVAVLVLVSLEPARNLFLHDLERHLQQKKISEPEQNIFNGDDDDDDDGDNFNDDDDDKDVADSFPSSSRLSDSLPKSINCCCLVVDFDGSSFLFKSNIGSFK